MEVITSGNISVGGSPAEGSELQGGLSKAWGFLVLRPLAKKAAPKARNSSNGKAKAAAEISRKCRAFQAFQGRGFWSVKNGLAKPAILFRDFGTVVPGRGRRNSVAVFTKGQ